MSKVLVRVIAVVFFVVAGLAAQAQTTCPVAQLTSPTPGSTLSGSTATFSWCNASADYFLTVESVLGAHDIFNAVVRVNSVTLINLPTNGGKVFVTLWTQISGNWQSPFNYTFTAAGSATTPPPPPPPPVNADYSLTASATSVNVSLSQPGTIDVTMTPINGFDGTVTLGCSGLPANVSCQFVPAELTGTGIPETTTLTVTQTQALAGLPALHRRASSSLLALLTLGTGAFGIVIAGVPKRRATRGLLLLVCCSLLLVALAGCGGGATSTTSTQASTPPPPSAARTISGTVTATAAGGLHTASTPVQQFQVQITLAP